MEDKMWVTWFGWSLLKDEGKSECALKLERLQYMLLCSELQDSSKWSKITKCINASHRWTETGFIKIFSPLNKQQETISGNYKQLI